MKKISYVKSIVRGVGAFTALSLLASFCNFLFNFIMIRLLSVQEFRDLTLANNMINVFGNLFVALNLISIAVFYVSKDRQTDIIRACQKIIYLLYVALLGACVIFNGEVQDRTGLHDTAILNLTLSVVFFSIPVMVLNAIYLGANRFNRSAIMNVSMAVGRLLLGVAGALLISSQKDLAAIFGILIVFVIVFAAFVLFEKESFRKQNLQIFKRIWDAPLHMLKRYRLLITSSILYAITINFLLGLDLFMFGQFFTNAQSADYAAVSIIGKLIFFFVAPISVYLATKQQQLVHTQPGFALKASLIVNALIISMGAILAIMPLEFVSLLIHRPAETISHSYLLLSLLFNAAVVMTNHQVIEAILAQRRKIAVTVTSVLLTLNGLLFLFFGNLRELGSGHNAALAALALPAATMIAGSAVLFVTTHLLRWQQPVDKAS